MSFVLYKQGDGWKAVSFVLGVVLLFLVVYEVAQSEKPQPPKTGLERMMEEAANSVPGGITLRSAQPAPQTWHEVLSKPVINESFDVGKWYAWGLAAHDPQETNLKFIVTGQFAANSPVGLAVMDDANYQRLQSGYPPLPAYGFTNSQPVVSFRVLPASTYMVFYQIQQPQAAPQIPTSMLGLGLLILRGLAQSAQVAHVTAAFNLSVEFYGNDASARAICAQLQQALAAQASANTVRNLVPCGDGTDSCWGPSSQTPQPSQPQGVVIPPSAFQQH